MEFIFPWPSSLGHWLAFLSAAGAVLLGLALILAPLIRRFRPSAGGDASFPAGSLAGGFSTGLGLAAILFDQPLIYLALGAAWGFAAVAAMIDLACRRGGGAGGWRLFMLQIALALMPLAYVFGYIA